jgi:hypothetical protein
MNLNSVSAFLGLRANASPTATNVTNDVQIGVSAQQIAFPDADAAYSVRMIITEECFNETALLKARKWRGRLPPQG